MAGTFGVRERQQKHALKFVRCGLHKACFQHIQLWPIADIRQHKTLNLPPAQNTVCILFAIGSIIKRAGSIITQLATYAVYQLKALGIFAIV